jgi:hypothetical protein
VDFIDEEILSGELVPILLGLSPETLQVAHRLYHQYNVLSHVFCNSLPLPLRLSLCMKYHVIRHTSDERLMLLALLDFAAQMKHADVIPCLIPCSRRFEGFIWEYRDQLERQFVIVDRQKAKRPWFGKEIPLQKGGRTREMR